MDRALKQRLVGASVLIALAVIILPMLLGGRPDPGQQTSEQIELPARPDSAAFETRRFPLGKEPTTSPLSVGAAPAGLATDTERQGSPGTGADDPTGSPIDTDQPTDPVAVAPGDSSAVTEQQEDNPAVESLPPVASLEVPVTEKVDLPVEVKAAEPSSVASGTTTAMTSGRYAVQVASLGSESNAKRLQQDLEKKGFKVISDKVESDVGRLSRVRVGPFDSEAEAAAAVKSIQSQVEGVNPRMVDLDPAAAPSLNPSDPLVRWVVQLGSFSETSNAENLVKQVRELGLSAYSERVSSSSGAAINRVRVGPFLQREDASKAQQSLKSSLSINGVVMSAD
ncbi:MAG TPA: SPOR domain-containing protein [Xanthomonadales bacterium]|nr:SPOR domain-containing protein [Xanthomonadales bacterium]